MDQALLPLCFGAITAYCADSEKCSACPARLDCERAVRVTIAKMREELNVEGLMLSHVAVKKRKTVERKKLPSDLTRPQRLEINPVGVAPVQSPSVALASNVMSETRAAVMKIGKIGSVKDIQASLAQGKNPFPKAMRETWLMTEILIRNQASEAMLELNLQKAGVSELRSRGVRAAFVQLKLASFTDGKYSIKG